MLSLLGVVAFAYIAFAVIGIIRVLRGEAKPLPLIGTLPFLKSARCHRRTVPVRRFLTSAARGFRLPEAPAKRGFPHIRRVTVAEYAGTPRILMPFPVYTALTQPVLPAKGCADCRRRTPPLLRPPHRGPKAYLRLVAGAQLAALIAVLCLRSDTHAMWCSGVMGCAADPTRTCTMPFSTVQTGICFSWKHRSYRG